MCTIHDCKCNIKIFTYKIIKEDFNGKIFFRLYKIMVRLISSLNEPIVAIKTELQHDPMVARLQAVRRVMSLHQIHVT